MRGLGDLWEIVEDEGIFVSYQSLRTLTHPTLGLYYWDKVIGRPCIVLDKRLNRDERLLKCVLAEEIGHHFTAPYGDLLLPYFSYSNHLKLSKDEVRALKWACDYLMPDDEFQAALRLKCSTVKEVAEYFDVTQWLVYRKLKFSRWRWRR